MQRNGYGGQANAARGEPNVIGIPTKWSPTRDPNTYFKDNDFDRIKDVIDRDFDAIKNAFINGKNIIFFPGIGKGLSKLFVTSPKTFNYINNEINTILRMSEYH